MNKLMTLVSVLVMASALSFGCKKGEDATKPAEGTTAPKTDEAKPGEMKPAEAPKPADAPKPAEGAAPAAAGSTGIPECDAYVAAAEKLAKCDKVPAEAKDAQMKGLEAAKQGWAALTAPNAPPEAKKSAADGCKASEDAVKTALSTNGCQ
jgi:hypothetical protein